MKFSFIKGKIPCGFGTQQTQSGYRLSNGIILLDSERDTRGYYLGAIGLDGMYLRTGKRYQPVFDELQHLDAFQEV